MFMLRKLVASAIVVFWILSAGIDSLEDFDLGLYFKIHNTERSAWPGLGQATKITNDDFEQGNRTLVAQTKAGVPPASRSHYGDPTAGETQVPKKSLRVYKLQGAFLI